MRNASVIDDGIYIATDIYWYAISVSEKDITIHSLLSYNLQKLRLQTTRWESMVCLAGPRK